MNESEGTKIAVYPGSFDPFTNGHRDILERALKLFDRVIIAVVRNPAKNPLFSFAEREEIIKNSVDDLSRIEVHSFDGLLVNFLEKKNARIIVKGLRALSDFEFEFQMALMNRKLKPEIETIFLMTSKEYTFLSSSRVKEIAALGGEVSCLISPFADEKLRARFRKSGKMGETVDKE